MKKIFTLIAAILCTSIAFAQVPHGFSYQALLRGADGKILKNQSVGIQISILQGDVNGIVVFTETQTPQTNENGLITIQIGQTVSISVDWTAGPFFIKTEVDPTGSTNYTITSTSQLLSVPFAMHAENATNAKTAESVINYNEMDPEFNASPAKNITESEIEQWNNMSSISGDNSMFDSWDKDASDDFTGDMKNQNIINLKDPSNAQDAATKKYIDGYISDIQETFNSMSGWDKDASDDFTGDMNNQRIKNVGNPLASNDAATKKYVTDITTPLEAKIAALEQMLVDANLLQLIDVEGNRYKTVRIGEQIWMAENLKVTKLNDGSPISEVTNNSAWGNTSPAYCWFNNDKNANSDYGVLYNGYAVATGKLCPNGWHAADERDWNTLKSYYRNNGIPEAAAGEKLKESGTSHWTNSNTPGDNESGFTALPGGLREESGSFDLINVAGFWWVAGTDNLIYLMYDTSGIQTTTEDKFHGASVRCVKD